MIYWEMNLSQPWNKGNLVLPYARALAAVGADVRVFPQGIFDRHDDLFRAAPELRGRTGPARDGRVPEVAVFCLPPDAAGARTLREDELPPRVFMCLTEKLPKVRKLTLKRLATTTGVLLPPGVMSRGDRQALVDAGCSVTRLPRVDDWTEVKTGSSWRHRLGRLRVVVIGPANGETAEQALSVVSKLLIGEVLVMVTEGGDAEQFQRRVERASEVHRHPLVRVRAMAFPCFIPDPEAMLAVAIASRVMVVEGTADAARIRRAVALARGTRASRGEALVRVGATLRSVLQSV